MEWAMQENGVESAYLIPKPILPLSEFRLDEGRIIHLYKIVVRGKYKKKDFYEVYYQL